MTKERFQAYEFRDRRFEFYSSGRMLVFQGAFCAAPMLLAYALESGLKAALLAVRAMWTPKDEDLVERGHKLRELYLRARTLGILQRTFISLDLLEYAEDHFGRRYPSGCDRLLEEKGYWSFGSNKVFAFDDAICQIDDALVNWSGDPVESMGRVPLLQPLRGPLVHAFFHSNPFTLARLVRYQASPGIGHSGKQWSAEELHQSKEFRYVGYPYPRVLELQWLNLAALFRYPRQGEPDPDPVGNYLDRCSVYDRLLFSKWVVVRLKEAFGSSNVAVENDSATNEFRAVVIDRTARKWWRTIVLESRKDPGPWILNDLARRKLDEWISSTKDQFRRKRRGLRVPPQEHKTRSAA